MKYQKPQLKTLNKSPIHAVCSIGSVATPFNACNSGGEAFAGCVANGTVASVINCQNGNNASLFGTSGCQIGIIPSASCNTGSLD